MASLAWRVPLLSSRYGKDVFLVVQPVVISSSIDGMGLDRGAILSFSGVDLSSHGSSG